VVYSGGILTPFHVAYHHATPHGVLSAVSLPDTSDPVPEEVLERLHPEEAVFARGLRGFRQVQFVGGRLALRAAAAQLGHQPPAMLETLRGAPLLPASLIGSVSHKRELAVALVAPSLGDTIGVDLEEYGPPRMSILERVLTPAELEQVRALPDDRAWLSTILRFSVKEAVYKALDPWVQRYVDFQEAAVYPDLEGRAEVSLDLSQREGPFQIEARYHWLAGRILTSVRIRPVALEPVVRTR